MQSTLKKIKHNVGILYDYGLQTFGKVQSLNYDIEQTIIVASIARGGSTWLANILLGLPRYQLIWEPLTLIGSNDICSPSRYGFEPLNYIPIDAQEPAKLAYLNQIFRGQMMTRRTIRLPGTFPQRLLLRRGFIVKFVEANMLLGWLTQNFNLRTVALIRHPCATIASQLRFGFQGRRFSLPATLLRDYPHLESIYAELYHPEEVLAFYWAIKYYVPFQQSATGQSSWLLTTYERLVRNGEQEIERIFDYLGEPVPLSAYD